MLHEFISKHVVRGACTCGKCFDAPSDPRKCQPNGHTADLHFFKVALQGEPDVEELKRLIKAHVGGTFEQVDLFDGKEHNYMEIGAWIGDQGMALMLMGMGKLLDIWELMTPEVMMPGMTDMHDILAGNGMITIKAKV